MSETDPLETRPATGGREDHAEPTAPPEPAAGGTAPDPETSAVAEPAPRELVALPFQREAWRLSRRTARALLVATRTGNAAALWLVTLGLLAVGWWHHWVLLTALVSAAAAAQLGRITTGLASTLYPAVYALTSAIGVQDAARVCTAFVTSPTASVIAPPVGLLASIAQQRHDAKAMGCAQGHQVLCPHRPPAEVPTSPAIRAALYGPLD